MVSQRAFQVGRHLYSVRSLRNSYPSHLGPVPSHLVFDLLFPFMNSLRPVSISKSKTSLWHERLSTTYFSRLISFLPPQETSATARPGSSFTFPHLLCVLLLPHLGIEPSGKAYPSSLPISTCAFLRVPPSHSMKPSGNTVPQWSSSPLS